MSEQFSFSGSSDSCSEEDSSYSGDEVPDVTDGPQPYRFEPRATTPQENTSQQTTSQVPDEPRLGNNNW